MATGRQRSVGKLKRTRKQIVKTSSRKDWSESIRLYDNTLLMYGKRGACYFMLHSQGFGRGFAYEADMIKAVNSFEFTMLGDNHNGNSPNS